MKKPKMVADLLAVADFCIEALKARARLLESCNKGLSKKKQEYREVNTVDRGDHRNRQQQPVEQKEKKSFRRPASAKKWCEIHHTVGHDLEDCKTFLDCKTMLAQHAVQQPHQGEHRRADPAHEDQMDEINVIFWGSMSIASTTQG
jgi:hypothetical protein